jgi:hypothetical protein
MVKRESEGKGKLFYTILDKRKVFSSNVLDQLSPL